MTMRFTSMRIWLLFVPTVLLFYVSLLATIQVRYSEGLPPEALRMHLYAFSVLYVVWVLNFYIHNLFEKQTFRRPALLLRNLISAMVVNTVIAIVYFYAQPSLIITPRRFLLVHVLFATACIVVWYFIVRYFIKNSFATQVYVVKINDELIELGDTIVEHHYLGFRFGGFIDDAATVAHKVLPNSLVIVPDGMHQNIELARSFYNLRSRGVSLLNHKRFYEELLRSVYLPTLNELWFLENIVYTEKRLYRIGKRVIDFAAALVAFSIWVITFPVLALAIKLDTSGPILFRQQRIGQNGKVFTIYKYRTMTRTDFNDWTDEKELQSRVTRVGKFLRKTRLDELPQCINILRGNMSLVGPRPEQVHIVETLRAQIPFYEERHAVKPGLTGWAQLHVYAATLSETKQKLQYDLYYVKHRSIGFDVEILLKTIYTVFSGSGR
jgi:exopolysaccharide biosynthesis polyprenyl glycosylphosphotransferase